MKDTGDLFSKICDMDNLRKAHKNASGDAGSETQTTVN